MTLETGRKNLADESLTSEIVCKLTGPGTGAYRCIDYAYGSNGEAIATQIIPLFLPSVKFWSDARSLAL